MRLASLDSLDVFELLKDDSKRIMEYKISKTEEGKMVLEMKMDVSDSVLELATSTKGTSQEKMQQAEQ